MTNFERSRWLLNEKVFPLVGKRFSPKGFAEYVKWVQENEPYSWEPTGITIHHTIYPNLSMRPFGLRLPHIFNIRHGYIKDNGWSRGPHIFTDDLNIWVSGPLSQRGIHAESYNHNRYGIEILGNFDTKKDFCSERGLKSMLNGKYAAAVLMKHAGISTRKLNFHRFDPKTSKTCPGCLVMFKKFEKEVLELVGTV